MAKTNLGKWSVGLILIMFLVFFIASSFTDTLYESVPAGSTIPADIISRPVLAISMLLGFGAGIFTLITGLISIIKQKRTRISDIFIDAGW